MDQSGSGGIVGPSENLNDIGQFYVEDAVASETTGKPTATKIDEFRRFSKRPDRFYFFEWFFSSLNSNGM